MRVAPAVPSDAIEMLVNAEPDTLDPRYANDAISSRASRLLHAGLMKIHPTTLTPVADVAERWHQDTPTRLRLWLGDRRFHSGMPVTCVDVRATLLALRSPEIRSRASVAFRELSDVECVSAHELVIQSRVPRASMLADLCFPILRATEAAGPPSETLDGLGPFNLESAQPGALTFAPAFPGANGAPTRRVRLRAVGDENARALRLLSGRADVASGVLSPLLAEALGKRGLHLSETEGANLTYIVARTDLGASSSQELRAYLRSAAPRRAIVDGMLAGHATLAEQILPPAVLGHAASAPSPLPPALATSARGMRTELLVGTDRVRVAIARAMADEWAKEGVLVDVVPLDLGVLLARLGRGDFSFAMLQLPDLTEAGLLRTLLHSALMPPLGMNRSHYANAEVDAWLDAAETESDPIARRALYARVERVNTTALALIPLWRERHLAVLSPQASSFAPGSDGHWGALCDIP